MSPPPDDAVEGCRVELCREIVTGGAWELCCDPMRLGSSIPPLGSRGGRVGASPWACCGLYMSLLCSLPLLLLLLLPSSPPSGLRRWWLAPAAGGGDRFAEPEPSGSSQYGSWNSSLSVNSPCGGALVLRTTSNPLPFSFVLPINRFRNQPVAEETGPVGSAGPVLSLRVPMWESGGPRT